MPSIKINKVAKDLGAGIRPIVDFLNEKEPDKGYNPNSKLTDTELKSVVQHFGGSMSSDERKALLDNYTHGSKVAQPARQSEEQPKKEEAPAKAEQGGLKVLGKVELDKHGNVVRPSQKTPEAPKAKPTVEAPKPVEKSLEKPVAETKPEPTEEAPKLVEKSVERPKAETPKVETPKIETPKAEEPKVEPKRELTRQEIRNEALRPQATKPQSKPAKAEPKAEVKPEAKPAEKVRKSEQITDATLLTTPDVGVKVVGKIDLASIQPERKRDSGKKRERKRIRGNKVDVEQEGKKQQSTQGTNKQGGKNNRPQGQGGNNQGRSGNRNNGNNQDKGRKAKRKQKIEEKPEITQEDIQKQIRETMAAIQGGRRKGANQAAKYRKEKREAHRQAMDAEEQAMMEDKTLQLTEYVTANDLAQMIDVPVNNIIMLCFNLGMMISINQRLEKDTIDLILDEYGYTPEYVEAQVLDMIEKEEDTDADLKPRAPIVTVMGHVDHGKTSLLDAIRNADVIATEAGGITQHIGAYSVTLDNGRKITLLDTPGHEAFTAMRARGAKVTDIVIVVVAADDGVMPQTKEALSHASLAGTPIIFAINKIDKPHANPDKIKEELANLNYLVEDWGGKYQSQEISAKKNVGIQELLEKVLLEADVMELKANPNKKAVASVLESTMEQGRGYTTKVLVSEGTLRVGDFILAGANFGKVKALFNERGKNVKSVGPSDPVKVLGLNGATQAGEIMNVLDTEQEAREIATRRSQLKREQRERTQQLPSLMDLSRRIAAGNIQELNIIVKGDMDGSVEALSDSIVKLSTEEIKVNVIHKGIGAISESDVILASASDAIIIGFQVRPAQGAKRIAEEEGVEIRTYSIIYDALDDVKTAMEGMLSPEIKERITANLEVRETFKVTKVGTIAGCYVLDGKVNRHDKVRVIRDGVVVHTGALGSLKRFKDDAREVVAGLECGLNIENYNDVLVGDIIEAYEEFKVERKL